MFNSFSPKPIEFLSNERVSLVPRVSPIEKNGRTSNFVELVPSDLVSPLDGVTFQSELMSLRAKLNLGVPMSKVPMPSLINDPCVVLREVQSFEAKVNEKLSKLKSQQASSEPVPTPEVKE